MADTRPTHVGFIGAVRLCLMLLFAPDRFIAAEQQDMAARNDYKDHWTPPHRAYVVRRTFFVSFLLVVAAGAVGYVGGKLMGAVGRCATAETVMWLQVAGACLLLWGTLFVRGWEIQTFAGVVFTERVNQWLYRFLYCVGTSVVVYSLAFPACAR